MSKNYELLIQRQEIQGWNIEYKITDSILTEETADFFSIFASDLHHADFTPSDILTQIKDFQVSLLTFFLGSGRPAGLESRARVFFMESCHTAETQKGKFVSRKNEGVGEVKERSQGYSTENCIEWPSQQETRRKPGGTRKLKRRKENKDGGGKITENLKHFKEL